MVPAEMQLRRKPSEDLSIEPEEFTEKAPPRPHFGVPAQRESLLPDLDVFRRPRIVVPISEEAKRQLDLRARGDGGLENERRPTKSAISVSSVLPVSRTRRALVALGLILAFSGMLLATHKYVTQRWNPLATTLS